MTVLVYKGMNKLIYQEKLKALVFLSFKLFDALSPGSNFEFK